ncbi:hypothetical protein ACOSQ3_031494 [Xanthoceras sorbifolium]
MHVPRLQTFKFQGIDEFVDFDFTLINDPEVKASNVTSCPSLHTLRLIDVKFEIKAFNSMISSIPGIENMTLQTCRFASVPKIESAKLKKLEVIDCYLQNKVLIIALQLESFSMVYATIMIFSGPVLVTYNSKVSRLSHWKYMRIISRNIQFLVVDECLDVEDGEIEAPDQLLYFKYVRHLLDFSRVTASEQLNDGVILS